MELPDGKYRAVVIDPPWPAAGYPSATWKQGPAAGCCPGRARGVGHYCHKLVAHENFDYPLMSLEEIAALEIPSILEPDAVVFVWTINRFVRDAFTLLDTWGLAYKFQMAWVKPHGPKPVGYPTYNLETVLVGTQGRAKFLDTRDFRTGNLWEAPPNESPAPGAWGRQIKACAKPEGFYELLRRVTPEPRLDMFARRAIEGFDGWGNEAPTYAGIRQDG